MNLPRKLDRSTNLYYPTIEKAELKLSSFSYDKFCGLYLWCPYHKERPRLEDSLVLSNKEKDDRLSKVEEAVEQFVYSFGERRGIHLSKKKAFAKVDGLT